MTTKLTYASLPTEIKKIANDSLGAGFLRSLFQEDETYHLMIKISDGAFIGFSLYHYEERGEGEGKRITGVIDCVCVSTPYRKEGFGTLLTFGTLRKMSVAGAHRVEITLKSPTSHEDEPGVPLVGNGEILEALGFHFVKTFHGYYEIPSKKFDFECRFCGKKPDTCRADLYSIDHRSV